MKLELTLMSVDNVMQRVVLVQPLLLTAQTVTHKLHSGHFLDHHVYVTHTTMKSLTQPSAENAITHAESVLAHLQHVLHARVDLLDNSILIQTLVTARQDTMLLLSNWNVQHAYILARAAQVQKLHVLLVIQLK